MVKAVEAVDRCLHPATTVHVQETLSNNAGRTKGDRLEASSGDGLHTTLDVDLVLGCHPLADSHSKQNRAYVFAVARLDSSY